MIYIAWILLFICGSTNDATAELKSSLDLQVFVEPRPVVIDGKPTLVYELHLTNFAEKALTLKCVSVLEASTEKQVFNVCDKALADRLSVNGTDKLTIHPRVRAVIYIEVAISGSTIPQSLKHRIQYERDHEPGIVEGANISLPQDAPLKLNPPLAGGPWIAIYAYSWERGHRRVFYAIDGKARIPGRFAIDWIQLDEDGRYAINDGDQTKNWHGYGADVLAVADATVVAARDNMGESETVSGNPHHKLEDASGNYVALDLGDGYFAFYEHLKPGSIRVKIGDRVRSGQVIASLGFTGDSTGPHLHFHVDDSNSTLAAEGVPYVFRNFRVVGSYDTLNEFGKKPWNPTKESKRTNEFPASNVVIKFD